jgi:phenylacetate-CoA ligase
MTAGNFPTLGQWSDFDGLREIWETRLPETLQQARHSDFYRDRLRDEHPVADVSGLASLPFTTKQDLRCAYPFGMVAVPRRRLVAYHESSGTSAGAPTASFHTEADWTELLDRFGRAVRFDDTDTVLIRVPYAMVTMAHQVHAAARTAGSLVIPADARSTAMTYRRVLRLLRDLRATVAVALPLEPLLWAACAQALGEPARSHAPDLRVLLVTGEPLSAARRRRLEELWGCAVQVSYGNSECGSNLAGQCPVGTLHLWADRYLPEIRDPDTGEIAQAGRGTLILTTLFREAMPLVRYDTGDMVELRYEPCDCGWPLPSVRVLGRWEQGLSHHGRRLFTSEVEEAVFGLPAKLGVMFWRAMQNGPTLRVQVEAEPAVADETEARLRKITGETLGGEAEVEVLPPGAIVPLAELTSESHTAKPRYLLPADDPRQPGLQYPARGHAADAPVVGGGTSLTNALERQQDRDRPVLRDALGIMSAGQALDLTYRLARTLIDFGHRPGRMAALVGPVSTRMYLLAHAIELTGGGRIEIPTVGMSAEDQVQLIAEVGATLLVADPGAIAIPATRAILERSGHQVLTLGPAPYGVDLMDEAARRPATPLPSRARFGDPNRVVLTGGTSGRAKPALRRFRPASPFGGAWLRGKLERDSVPVRLLKTGRLTGLGYVVANAALLAGGEFVSLTRFDPAQVVPLVATLGITHLYCSPCELRQMLESPDLDGANLQSLRFVASVTSATSPALLTRAVERLGPVIYPCYGQTEAGLITALEPEHYAEPDPAILRSCGMPVPGVSVEIRDPAGVPLGPGDRGEIWVRTPGMMDEYWGRPADTARVLRDGWLNTGDIGFRDTRGFLTLLGRANDAIPVPGGHLFSCEVDYLLHEHPAVRDSATFDMPAGDGVSLHAAVVTAPGATVTEAELRDMLAAQLPPGNVPASVMFVDRIPLTYANETCRDTLRHWHRDRAAPATGQNARQALGTGTPQGVHDGER